MRPAYAADDASFALSWVRLEGAESCPGRAVLAREVISRLGRNPFSETAERSLEVVASREQERWLVRIHVRDSSGNSQGFRTLDSFADDCGAVFSATVLALALSVSPEGQLQAGAAPSAAASSGATATGSVPGSNEVLPASAEPAPLPQGHSQPAAAPTSAVQQPQPRAPAYVAPVQPLTPPQRAPALPASYPPPVAAPLPVPPRASQPQDARPPFAASERLLSVGVGVGPALAFRLLPRTTSGLVVHGRATSDAAWGLDVGALLLNQARTDAESDGADIGVGLSSGYLGVNFALIREASLVLSVAAGAALGVQQVVVYSPVPLADGPGNYFWAALRAGSSLDLRVSGPFGVGLGAEALIPVTQHEYQLEGGRPIFSSPSVGFLGHFALRLTSD